MEVLSRKLSFQILQPLGPINDLLSWSGWSPIAKVYGVTVLEIKLLDFFTFKIYDDENSINIDLLS